MPDDLTIAQQALKRWRADTEQAFAQFAKAFPDQLERGVQAEIFPPSSLKDARAFVQTLQASQSPQEVEAILQQRIQQVGIAQALKDIQRG